MHLGYCPFLSRYSRVKSLSERYSLRLSYQEERERMRSVLKKIEEVIKRENFSDRMEIILGALINNAVKANLRRLFFHTKGFDFDTLENYERGLQAFSENFPYLNLNQYEKAMKLLDVKIDIQIDLDTRHLLILIQSANAMSQQEELCLRKKLKKIMETQPENMHSLYLHFGDDVDDESLGLAMIVDMMDKMGFDPRHFRLYSDKKYTRTRLEFPLSSDYKPIREEAAALVSEKC